MIGSFIGPYRIDREVASGGFGTVYSATDPVFDRRVAIKVVKLPEDRASHASFLERFRVETEFLSNRKHSSIIAILGQGVLPDGAPYFVMEWVEGETLGDIISRDTTIPLPNALWVAHQVAGALSVVHEQGYLHRDVKPQNIIVLDRSLASPWTIRLIDFGSAVKLDDATGMYAGGVVVGTPRYMSPEQIRGAVLTPASDIWQFGVALFEMLVGSSPFKGDSSYDSLMEIIRADVTVPKDAKVPPSVMDFVLRCLSKNVSSRPANGAEALKAIKKLEDDFASGIVGTTTTLSSVGTYKVSAGSRKAQEREHLNVSLFGHFAAGLLSLFAASQLFILHSKYGFPSSPWFGVLAGACLGVGGVFLGKAVTVFLSGRHSEELNKAQDKMTHGRRHDQLTQTLAIQVDDIAARCRMVDERFLAMTMAVMIDEYGASITFDDRQKALMNAVALLDKLKTRLSPWYIRYEKAIALVVTFIGILSGVATIAASLAKFVK